MESYGLKGVLTRAFYAATFAATFSIANLLPSLSLSAQNAEQAKDDKTAVTQTTFDSQIELWKEILSEQSLYFGNDNPSNVKPDSQQKTAKTITTIMIEKEAYDDEALLLLKPPTSSGHKYLSLSRHGESAAQIIEHAANNEKVDVHYIESPLSLKNWVYNLENAQMQALFLNADIISLSMSYSTSGVQRKKYSVGEVDTLEEIELADSFWEQSRAIFIKAAGNHADKYDDDMEREHAFHTLRADTYLSVGEAIVSPHGTYVVDYSSRLSGIAFVALNPYHQGFKTRYVKTESDILKECQRFYKTIPQGCTMPGHFIFAQMLQLTPEKKLRDRLKACHSEFSEAKFIGKDILENKDIEWIRSHPDEVLEAFINGIVSNYEATIRSMNEEDEADQYGMITKLNGTSFSSPNSAGFTSNIMAELADTSENPLSVSKLNEYEIVAAMLIGAEPIFKIKTGTEGQGRQKKPVFGRLRYSENGCGIPFNNSTVGFGLIEQESGMRVAQKMSEILAETPNVPRDRVSVDSGMVKFKNDHLIEENPNYTDYTITLMDKQDIVALSTHIAIEFDCDTRDVPLKLTLISPNGGFVNLSVSRTRDSEHSKATKYSLARELGHFGNHTAGDWTLQLHQGPHDIDIKSARLTIKGMPIGGVVDLYIQKYGGDLPPLKSDKLFEDTKELLIKMDSTLQGFGINTQAAMSAIQHSLEPSKEEKRSPMLPPKPPNPMHN